MVKAGGGNLILETLETLVSLVFVFKDCVWHAVCQSKPWSTLMHQIDKPEAGRGVTGMAMPHSWCWVSLDDAFCGTEITPIW
jgi:hypothetical protein